jgi:YD repeat-containing protein
VTELEFKFEDCPARPAGPIQQFSGALASIMTFTPTVLPSLSASRAEYMSNGLFDTDAGLWSRHAALEGARRLTSIEHEGSTLLQYRYDDKGRLSETVFLGDRIERYVRDREGFVTAVKWCGEDTARFERRDNGRLSAVTYADGGSFRFSTTKEGLIERLRYPDGIECVLQRDEDGRIESVTCRDTMIRYEWSDGSQLVSIKTETPAGTSRLVLDRRHLVVDFEPEASRYSGVQRVRSALGRWTFDAAGVPLELVSPFDFRLCRTNDDNERTMTFWSPSGQTAWRFTRAGLLDSVVHSNGMRTAYIRSSDPSVTFALTGHNLGILKYEAGWLKIQRTVNGSYLRFVYTENNGNLATVETPASSVQFESGLDSRLMEIRAGGNYRISGGIMPGIPSKIVIRVDSKLTDLAAALAVTSRWHWEWRDCSLRWRLWRKQVKT